LVRALWDAGSGLTMQMPVSKCALLISNPGSGGSRAENNKARVSINVKSGAVWLHGCTANTIDPVWAL